MKERTNIVRIYAPVDGEQEELINGFYEKLQLVID